MMLRMLAQTFLMFRRMQRRSKMLLLRPAFKRYGRNFVFDPDGAYSYATIEVGDDVFIGPGAILQASEGGIIMGSKIMFGPNVTIMGGDHNTSIVGRFMYDVHEKRPQDDQAVVIEDEVWIGAGATILKGVRLGRGSIVAAGAVVTRSTPPYTVVAGVPAQVIKIRFALDTILRHEDCLYPREQRFSRDQLENMLGDYWARTGEDLSSTERAIP